MSWYENPMSPLNLGAYSTPLVNQLAGYGASAIPVGNGTGLPASITGQIGATDISSLYGPTSAAPVGVNDLAASLGTVDPIVGPGAAAATTAASAAPAASWLGSLGEGVAGGSGLLAKGAGFIRGPAGPSVLGALAAKGVNTFIPSQGTPGNVRSILAGAAQGAGIGTSIGLAGGPFDAVTVPVGAIGGGIIGGLAGLGSNLGFFGGDSSGASDKDLRGTLEANAKMMGLSPSDYTSKFDLATKAGMTDAKGNKLSNQDIANYLGSQMSSEVATTRAQNEASAQALEFHKADLANNLALQTQAHQFMQPYQNNIIASGVNQAKVLNSLADQMPGAYKGVFQAQAASALNQAQSMAGAYMQQMSLQPTMQILNNYQQQQQAQLANQAKIMQYAAQMRGQGGGAGGGVDFSQLLAGQGASPTGAAAGPYG